MSSLSADTSIYRPKYDEEFPPIERENPVVVQLRKELRSARHQLVVRNAKVSELEEKFNQSQMRADWLENWKDKFKTKACLAVEENKRLCDDVGFATIEISELKRTVEKQSKELTEMRESRVVLREDHELQISRNERRHLKVLVDLQDECDKNISTWVENNRKLEAEIVKLKEDVECGRDTYNSLNDRYRSVLAEVRELRNTSHVNEEWIGRSLKLKWIFDEMLKVGAVKLPDHEWATDMVHELEFPTGSGNSVFCEVSRNIRETYLPSVQDAHMEWVDEEDENELIRRLSEEATDFTNSVGNNIFASLETDRENTINHIITIQKHIRGYLARLKISKKDPSAIIIQKYWRRFYTSPIRYQNYSALDRSNAAPGVLSSASQADRDVYRRSITLVNTGCIDYQYRYISPGRGPVSPVRYIRQQAQQNISTMATHWFHISMKIPGQGNIISRKIRIPKILANGYSRKWVFDVHTGVCFSHSLWTSLMIFFRRERTIHVPTMPILLQARPSTGEDQLSANPPFRSDRDDHCNCERCVERRQETELEIQEIEDMQRAIRLSLLDAEIDYTESLNNMFLEPEEIHLNNDEGGYDNFIEMGGLGGWVSTYDDY